MHDLLLDLLAAARPRPVLARMPLDGGALVAAFDPEGAQRLRWVGKTGYGEAACQRLRAEARALAALEPVAERLHIPRLLGFRESGSGAAATACLAQTGIEGTPLRPASFHRPGLSPADRLALDWVERFQPSAPLLPSWPTLADLAAAARTRVHAAARREPDLAPLLQWMSERLSEPIPDLAAVPVHGDFWPGNVLVSRQLGVVDWSGFGPGSALEDVLNWFTYSGRAPGRLDLVLQPGPVRACLRSWALRAGLDPAAARFAFYLFVARRSCWELGLDLQARNPAELALARRQWSAALALLAARPFPDPFTRASPFAVAAGSLAGKRDPRPGAGVPCQCPRTCQWHVRRCRESIFAPLTRPRPDTGDGGSRPTGGAGRSPE